MSIVFSACATNRSQNRWRSVRMAGALVLVTSLPLSATAASKTNKTGRYRAVPPVSAKTVAKATLPPAVTPAKDLIGWESLTEKEWPKSLDAVRARATNTSIRVHRAPDDFSPALQMTSGKSAFGAIAFLALGQRTDWVRVLLPLRPNGSIGWVRTSEVALERMPYRIIIEVNTNTLTVDGPDGTIVTTKVALGTNNTPTPTGLFYIREIVPQANPNGGLGPVALGLSGLSEELRSFAGGFGRVAIHGTNAPGKIGTDVSHGCVRMDNATITRLAKLLPLGTPVEIVSTRSDLVADSARLTSAWIAVPRPAPGERPSALTDTGVAASTTLPTGSIPSTTSVVASAPGSTVVQAGVTVAPTTTPGSSAP